jgi:hypothetical protein
MTDNNIFVLVSENLTTLWGILLYWVPTAFCAFGYLIKTAENTRKDIVNRDRLEREKASDKYVPTDTIGSIIGRGIVSIMPVANLFAAVFDVAPTVFGRFFAMVGRVFNQPIVPPRNAK